MEIDCIYKGGKSHNNNALLPWLCRKENPMLLWQKNKNVFISVR